MTLDAFCPHCRQWQRFAHIRANVWQCGACRMEALMPPGYEALFKPEKVIDATARTIDDRTADALAAGGK